MRFVVGLFAITLWGQTAVNNKQLTPGKNTAITAAQVKDVGPVALVERAQCVGSGTGTYVDPSGNTVAYTWNCAGLQTIKVTLRDGTVVGPYVNIPMPAATFSDSKWQPIALTAPDPTGPDGTNLRK